ncbi:sensor histidine kinase [Actinacidiphila oryziradicis]|uniref:histidine kinase n=1 Tax=Actinacidiphila oryziradicis TaxID=2571141 RepID=A0A4U0SPY5_9ACTN|nr:HAMP domain-containing sensor histidine kinase [Actinacidiphila oryziradicis]TKA11368.1 HAMP domain-containing protein [Actinacidiphila oryziradicis]
MRTRLVVSSIVMIAVVCSVIGAVTTLALRSFLFQKVDKQVADVAQRAVGGPSKFSGIDFLTNPVLGPGVVGAQLNNSGEVTAAGVSVPSNDYRDLDITTFSAEQAKAFAGVANDHHAHTIVIPGHGSYRVIVITKQISGAMPIVVGLSISSIRDTVNTLLIVELCLTAAGLAAAGLAGSLTIRYSLRPLHRVAATAGRVSELPLARGEVTLHERVPEVDTDPRTEVGQVGAALNRMLDHVGYALHARQASETRVRQFVADASHELRTPLASIRGYAELTRRGREEIGPETRHALGRIESEASRMTTLVEDLLLLARLDAGRPLDLVETDMSPLVVDAVSDARASAAGRDHVWRLELPDDPATVQADPARLHQVLTNLLANARTHTPPGTTVIARVVPRGPEVLIEVADNGPGIPPALLPHVFERFARGDASRSRAAGSTGLGLAIVHAVVAAHRGKVVIESVPGNTIFRVHLPVTHSQVPLSLATTS